METHKDFIFTSTIGKLHEVGRKIKCDVVISIDSQAEPLELLNVEWMCGKVQTVDYAFHRWVLKGDFAAIKDPELRSILLIVQRERRARVVWHKRTWRFLQTENEATLSTEPSFTLTTDKTGVADWLCEKKKRRIDMKKFYSKM